MVPMSMLFGVLHPLLVELSLFTEDVPPYNLLALLHSQSQTFFQVSLLLSGTITESNNVCNLALIPWHKLLARSSAHHMVLSFVY
jgi:hypothetical protein